MYLGCAATPDDVQGARMSEPDDLLLIGRWIERERKARGWSRPQLAKRSGVAPNTVYLVENGANSHTQTLMWLVDALGGKVSLTSAVRTT
jgi:ribosome-binding protein aMBF1 (putative translation factor)